MGAAAAGVMRRGLVPRIGAPVIRARTVPAGTCAGETAAASAVGRRAGAAAAEPAPSSNEQNEHAGPQDEGGPARMREHHPWSPLSTSAPRFWVISPQEILIKLGFPRWSLRTAPQTSARVWTHSLERGFACLVAHRAARYVRAMRNRVTAAIDAQLADLIVSLARRRWPALRLMPAVWIRPAVTPAAIRLRRTLSAAALILGAATGLIVAVLAVV